MFQLLSRGTHVYIKKMPTQVKISATNYKFDETSIPITPSSLHSLETAVLNFSSIYNTSQFINFFKPVMRRVRNEVSISIPAPIHLFLPALVSAHVPTPGEDHRNNQEYHQKRYYTGQPFQSDLQATRCKTWLWELWYQLCHVAVLR